MKKILVTTLLTTLSSISFAGSLNVDMRVDYNSSNYTDSAVSDFSKFYFKTGRLDYQNSVNEALSYRVRLAFNKDATTGVDTTQTALEYGYLTNKLSNDFSVTIGKLNSDVGGFEGATSGADLYLLSQHYSLKGPNGDLDSRAAKSTTPGNNVSTSDLLYLTGAKATYSFSDQTISLLATNETGIAAANGSTADQNTSLLGLIWRGSFQEKTLMTNLSYHTMAGANSDDRHALSAAGVQWNQKPYNVQVDYLMNEFKEGSTGKKDTVTSIVTKFSYTGFEQWIPRLEIQSSEEKLNVDTTATNKFLGYGLVAEYKPVAETNFRYHVAVNHTQEKFDAALNKSDSSLQEIVVGARLMADILK